MSEQTVDAAGILEWIRTKRDGGTMSPQEIEQLVAAYAQDQVPEYQMAAWTMAAFIRGLSWEEARALTLAMLRSGTRIPRSGSDKPRVDKHSTGGVGDKVSLVLAPLLASCGLEVPMISGRGLGFTGGTLDKLESVPGLTTELPLDRIVRIVQEVGCVIAAQSPELVPADRKLYALRDATATVESFPLIAASILSKKLAEQLDMLVLDVKWGTGALMRSLPQARQLARYLVQLAQRCHLPAVALVTNMNQPLGQKVGNSLEVIEALETLRAGGPPDLVQVVLHLGAELMVGVGMAPDHQQAQAQLRRALQSGQGYECFARMVRAQGGNLEAPLPVAPVHQLHSTQEGYLVQVETQVLGQVVVRLGGGRTKLGQKIDPSVGLEMRVRPGQWVHAGDPLLRVFAPEEKFHQVQDELLAAFRFGEVPPAKVPMITFAERGPSPLSPAQESGRGSP